MVTVTSQIPTAVLAEQNVERLRRASRTQNDFDSKNRALKAITRASISLPVLTIATSERVRLEIEAKRRADANLAEYHAVSGNIASPPSGYGFL